MTALDSNKLVPSMLEGMDGSVSKERELAFFDEATNSLVRVNDLRFDAPCEFSLYAFYYVQHVECGWFNAHEPAWSEQFHIEYEYWQAAIIYSWFLKKDRKTKIDRDLVWKWVCQNGFVRKPFVSMTHEKAQYIRQNGFEDFRRAYEIVARYVDTLNYMTTDEEVLNAGSDVSEIAENKLNNGNAGE